MATASLAVRDHCRRAISLLAESFRSPIQLPLLAANLFFIFTHLIVATSPNEHVGSWSDFLRIDRDRSLSEWFETSVIGTAILLLLTYARRDQRLSYMIVAALLAFMMFDNLFTVHEFEAKLLMPKHQSSGELAILLANATIFAGFALLAFRQAGNAERSALAAMFMLLVVFAFFAIAMDFLHDISLAYGSSIYAAMSVAEDGGELITLSVFLVLVLHLTVGAPAGVTPSAEA